MNIGNCSICLDNFKTIEMAVLRNCGHSFHQKCISRAIKIKKECPLCRTYNKTVDLILPKFDGPVLSLPCIKNEAINIAFGYYDRIYKQNGCSSSHLSQDEQREQLHSCLLNLLTTIEDQTEEEEKNWESLRNFIKVASIASVCAILAFFCYLYWPVISPIAGRIASIVWSFIKGLRDFLKLHQPEILAGIFALMEFGLAWKVSEISEENEES
ncbi:RING-type domain-containing protein [Meloidogyne graminicola]|uniref:RING-type domain-containing protein n=1 Tax=Meloidogyne graminicola TaxID=189291 RepID=A0A8S9ZMF4_9BILA|nr:RING-type domain-containing protein [Meloidogyne graminicola]